VPKGEPEATAREYFLEAYRQFEQKHDFTARIFKVVGGQKRDQRRFWANLLFLRLSMIGLSLLHLCQPELRNREKNSAEATCALDPTSISAVGRTLLEACVMFLYVSELSVPEPEWSLRRKVLELNDLTARYRMTKDIGLLSDGDEDRKDALEFKKNIEAIRGSIASDPIFQGLDVERQKKVLGGQELYINGFRTVVREGGLNVDEFNVMYATLSAHAHSAPVSFVRNILEPSEPILGFVSGYQYSISGNALTYATAVTERACERMFFLYPELFLKGQTNH
jgi:hypothetical protein